ncbi:MAG: serine hydrolase domain-containing protein, partial [Chthonomonadales bacterium]
MNLEFDVVEKLEPMATKFMGDHSVPCLSVAFGSGKGRFAHAFGFANVETKKTATADSRFRIASISKPITSAAIFKLIEKG